MNNFLILFLYIFFFFLLHYFQISCDKRKSISFTPSVPYYITNSFYLNSNELISKSHSLQHPNSREFKNLRRQLRGKRHIKIADYSMLITLYKISGVHFRLLGTNGFHVKAKNERFTAASSRCLQNLKYENFMPSFGSMSNAAKSVPHVQQDSLDRKSVV